jgi:hypothetical protein
MPKFKSSSSKAKKSTSPWIWAGIGCGTAVLLTFGGCIALGLFATQHAVQEFSKPVDSKDAVAKLGNIPIYRPSTFNELITKKKRLETSLFPGIAVSTAAFDTSTPPNQVLNWYEQQLAKKGYRATSKKSFSNSLTQVSFQNQTDGIILQVRDFSKSSRKNYSFTLIRVKHPPRQKQG